MKSIVICLFLLIMVSGCAVLSTMSGSGSVKSCKKSEVVKEQDELYQLYKNYCDLAADENWIPYVADWGKKRDGYISNNVLSRWESFATNHPKCADKEQLTGCRKAKDGYGKTLAKTVTPRLWKEVKRYKGYIAKAVRTRQKSSAVSYLKRIIKIMEEYKHFVAGNKKINRQLADFRKKKHDWEAADVRQAKAKLENTRCVSKNVNPGLARRLKRVFKAWYDRSFPQEKVQILNLRVPGNKTRTTRDLAGNTYEYIEFASCVKRTMHGKRGCVSTPHSTAVRTRAPGRKWSGWRLEAGGDGIIMLCKNVK